MAVLWLILLAQVALVNARSEPVHKLPPPARPQRTVCKIQNKEYKIGEKWLANRCNKVLQCQENGPVIIGPYECPATTQCQREHHCVCRPFFVPGETKNALLQNCLPNDRYQCVYNGKTIGFYHTWREDNCKTIKTCINKGRIKTKTKARCPRHSSCVDNKCVCEGKFIAKREVNGLLQRCSANKDCVFNGKTYQDGDQWISDDCTQTYSCSHTKVRSRAYKCPRMSSCLAKGLCVCDDYYVTRMRDWNTILKSCKADPTRKKGQCYNTVTRRFMRDGDEIVTDNCQKVQRCVNEQIVKTDFECPVHADCRHNRCVCKRNYHQTERSPQGFAKRCDYFGHVHKCHVAGRYSYSKGQVWLDEKCSVVRTCKKGRIIYLRPHHCPANSLCVGGKCVCREGYVTDKDNLGMLLSCKAAQNAMFCLVGEKRFVDGDQWMDKDCTTLRSCTDGAVTSKAYKCPERSTCKNFKCQCDKQYTSKRKRNGLLTQCIEHQDCAYEGKTYKNRDSWLDKDCKTKMTCMNKKITNEPASCPANSHCQLGGYCVCDFGFETKFRSKSGDLNSCREKTKPKKCHNKYQNLFEQCVRVYPSRRHTFMEGRDFCQRISGRLLVTEDLYRLTEYVARHHSYRHHKFFILGAPELLALGGKYKNRLTKLFVLRLMQQYGVHENDLEDSIRRFSGGALVKDWNFKSAFSSLCLAVSKDGPELVRCSTKMGFICTYGSLKSLDDLGGEFGTGFWTKYFDSQKKTDREDESLSMILKKFNKKYLPAREERMCKRPSHFNCREVGTDKIYSPKSPHGVVLNQNCRTPLFKCFDNRQNPGYKCPDIEMRFYCPMDDSIDCSVKMMKRHCQRQGKECFNHRTGPICVKVPKSRILNRCTVNSKTYDTHMCRGVGDPHYLTLDGLRFDFMGTCTYDFMSSCNNFPVTDSFPNFRIFVKNFKRSPSHYPAWTKSVDFHVRDIFYKFAAGKFYVNEIEMNPVDYSDNEISIQAQSMGWKRRLQIKTSFCLEILWDDFSGIWVRVPDVYKEHICGFCGNYDGNKSNDLRKPGSSRRMNSNEMGRYYLVKGSDDSKCPLKIEEPKACSKAKLAKFRQPKFCGVLDPNKKGIIAQWVRRTSPKKVLNEKLEGLKDDFEECVNDLCWDPATDRCSDLEELVQDLMEALGPIDSATDQKWRKQSGCQPKCNVKPNMVYSYTKKPACQNTCLEPDKASDCLDEGTKSGCVCKNGFVLDGKLNCVPKSECLKTCAVQGPGGRSFTMNDGDEFVKSPCELMLVCKKGILIGKKLPTCSIHAECVKGGKLCVCRDGYIGDGKTCKTDLTCRLGWTSIGEKCYKYVGYGLDWHKAAINCGAQGGSLARYDVKAEEELVTFFTEMPIFASRMRASRRTIVCKPGAKCEMPKGYFGLSVTIRSKKDRKICKGKFSLAKDKKSLTVKEGCEARFQIIMANEANKKLVEKFKVWIGGNTFVLGPGTRGNKRPLQVDPPRLVDLSVFPDPHGCFMSNVNRKGSLIVTPNPNCNTRMTSICEYDNVGKIVYDPLDFRRPSQKTNYQKALELCKKMDRPLARFPDDSLQAKILKKIKNLNEDVWIGAQFSKSKDAFVWSNDKPLTYINWAKREPNNYKNNTGSNEQCVAMNRKTGAWYTDNCDKQKFPVCGPPLHMDSIAYSKYYSVKGFYSLSGLQAKLKRQTIPDYVCKSPLVIECSAKETKTGVWRNNRNQRGQGLTCEENRLKCRKGQGLDCSTFRVRFMCPPGENHCDQLKADKIDPCSGRRICLPVKNHYTCSCPKGQYFSSKTQSCYKHCGICWAAGDPHYTSFGGLRFDFMGQCMYKFTGICDLGEFATSPNFDVYTKNNPCGNRGAACIHTIEVHLRNIPHKVNRVTLTKNYIFRVARGEAQYLMNDKTMDEGILEIPGVLKVIRKRNSFQLSAAAVSLEVFFLGTFLKVTVPSRFRDKMCGLCGDCASGNFRMKNGTIITVTTLKKGRGKGMIRDFGSEWIVPFDGSDPEKCKAVPALEPCSAEMTQKLKRPDMCGIFKDKKGRLSECFNAVDPSRYYDDCTVDACHDKMEESVCRTVKTYAQACMEKDIVLSWRTEDFCPLECGNKLYRADASCEPMCGRDANVCEEEPQEGCVCPDGFMKQGDDCVRPEKCGCEVVTDKGDAFYLKPGKSMLLPRCEEKVTCEEQEDGTLAPVREPVAMPPNTVCEEDIRPTITCAKGFVMNQDGKTCKREVRACTDGYLTKGSLCVKVPSVTKPWRQSVETCNEKDGTLVRVDTDVKLKDIGKLMKEKDLEQVFISGVVRPKVVADGDVAFLPVLGEKQRDKAEYANYDFDVPFMTSITLSDDIDKDTMDKDTQLVLVLRREEEGSVAVVAVSKDTKASFICEERAAQPEEEEWYGPCNSDDVMEDNGDVESKQSLEQMTDCSVCTNPSAVKCSKVKGSKGSVDGECSLNKNGQYYVCDQGSDCIDKAVSTKCAKDVDECAAGLDDCPPRSTCKNTIGGYFCICDKDMPVMVDGKCQATKTCVMEGPDGPGEEFEYEMTGFSTVPGIFGFKCPFIVFDTCVEKYKRGSDLPMLKVMTQHVPGKTVSSIVGIVKNPVTEKMGRFMVTEALLKTGKFMFGIDDKPMQAVTTGFSHKGLRTSFTLNPPKGFRLQHFDQHFDFIVSFPMTFKMLVSSTFAEMGCGMCTLSPPGPEQVIKLTPAQERELTGNKDQGDCYEDLGEKENVTVTTTTTPSGGIAVITTTTPATGTDTTTTPAPPTVVVACTKEVEYVCDSLKDLCEEFDRTKCIVDLCTGNIQVCNFLLKQSVSCKLDARFKAFISKCDKACSQDMRFAYTKSVKQERCQDADEFNKGDRVSGLTFGCLCNKGYKLSGRKCVPKEECGCTDADGMYMKQGEAKLDINCTVQRFCAGDNKVIEEKVQCSDDADCVLRKDVGYRCQCKEGFFGNADKKDGCQKGVEDERKVCYNYTNTDGIDMKKCNCKDGYVSDCRDCVDLDECTENRHDCDLSMEKCVNTPGSFKCSCADGMLAVGGKCVDVDECKQGTAHCGTNEGCFNTIGSYMCICCTGFKYNQAIGECQPDPKSDVEILVEQPKCCLQCDKPKLCDDKKTPPTPYCFQTGPGNFKPFPSYKALFQYTCVNNIKVPKDSVTEGKCPQVLAPNKTPAPPTGEKTPPGGTGGTDEESINPDTSTNGKSTSPASPTPTPAPPSGCADPNFCSSIPQPPPSLATGPVCGPPSATDKQTYPSYCDMVKDICRKLGGPGSLPKVPISAIQGKCPEPTTTTTPPPPPKPTEKPTNPETGPNPGPTAAPGETTTRVTPTKPTEPSKPLFLEWSAWSKCRVRNVAATCGLGVQRRTRTTMDYEDAREVDPVTQADLQEKRTCFLPCDPTDPNFKTDQCPDVSLCDADDSPVCGSFGRTGQRTFTSQCEMNIMACQAGDNPVFISEGDCSEAGGPPKKLCDEAGPQEVTIKYKEDLGDNIMCVGEEKTIKVCKGLVCEGDSETCCVPTGYEKVTASYTCYNEEGGTSDPGTMVYISVTGCKCQKAEDDEFKEAQPESKDDE